MCKKCFAFDIKKKLKSFILWLIYSKWKKSAWKKIDI